MGERKNGKIIKEHENGGRRKRDNVKRKYCKGEEQESKERVTQKLT